MDNKEQRTSLDEQLELKVIKKTEALYEKHRKISVFASIAFTVILIPLSSVAIKGFVNERVGVEFENEKKHWKKLSDFILKNAESSAKEASSAANLASLAAISSKKTSERAENALDSVKEAAEKSDRIVKELNDSKVSIADKLLESGEISKIVQDAVKSKISPIQMHSFFKEWKVSKTTRKRHLDIDLNDTKAKFILANIFAIQTKSSDSGWIKGGDHVIHLFGRNIPEPKYWYQDGVIQDNATQQGKYVLMVKGGEDAGSDHYGTHGTFLIPLNDDKTLDVTLAYGYTFGEHTIKLNVLAYIE